MNLYGHELPGHAVPLFAHLINPAHVQPSSQSFPRHDRLTRHVMNSVGYCLVGASHPSTLVPRTITAG